MSGDMLHHIIRWNVVFLVDPGSPLRPAIRAIHPYFAQFLAGAAPLLEDFPCTCLV